MNPSLAKLTGWADVKGSVRRQRSSDIELLSLSGFYEVIESEIIIYAVRRAARSYRLYQFTGVKVAFPLQPVLAGPAISGRFLGQKPSIADPGPCTLPSFSTINYAEKDYFDGFEKSASGLGRNHARDRPSWAYNARVERRTVAGQRAEYEFLEVNDQVLAGGQ
jgi:hypothetical protein